MDWMESQGFDPRGKNWENGRPKMFFGYFFGNDVDTYIKYPSDTHRLGIEDVRFIFWFDN